MQRKLWHDILAAVAAAIAGALAARYAVDGPTVAGDAAAATVGAARLAVARFGSW